MSNKLSVKQVQDRLPELLDQLLKTGEEYVVQRDGKDCAVIVRAQDWRLRRVGQQLDKLGDAYRLSKAKQSRVEELLEAKKEGSLTVAERRELNELLRQSDEIMLRRAAALDQ
jgi:antitoxin (DNA-binding transcriptional repressor) of toxin-antitoxin stability system